jgi:threonine dehydrogenase-like Zn-dependent dehydrogenase
MRALKAAEVELLCPLKSKGKLIGVLALSKKQPRGFYSSDDIDLFTTLARKNACLRGSWVSDTSHLWVAMNLVAAGRYPFDRLITHQFPLEQATEGLKVTESKESVKAVLRPE